MTINNVTIGDKFKTGKNIVSVVVDFIEKKSMITGQIIGYICIAKGIDTLAVNTFEVPFATIMRNKI